MNKKGGGVEPGYIYAPYIISTNNCVVIEEGKVEKRRRKIGNIFNIEVIEVGFSPKKQIRSRYSNKIVNNNFYQTIKTT